MNFEELQPQLAAAAAMLTETGEALAAFQAACYHVPVHHAETKEQQAEYIRIKTLNLKGRDEYGEAEKR